MTLNETKDFFRWVGKWVLLTYMLSVILTTTPLMRDSTDEQGWLTPRSNMEVHRDNLTGCQYLSAPSGGITPRMLHGRHMGCKSA
jgi:hypothetical protein